MDLTKLMEAVRLLRAHLLPFFSALYIVLRASASTLMRTMFATSLERKGAKERDRAVRHTNLLAANIHTSPVEGKHTTPRARRCEKGGASCINVTSPPPQVDGPAF